MNIYVGNLSSDTSEQDLEKAFQEFGIVASVAIIKDRYTGRSRGFAFVEMPLEDDAKAAIGGMTGKALNGRTLVVNRAHPRSGGGDEANAPPGRIQNMADHLEIEGLLTRYCTTIDSKKYDLLDSVFTPEAIIDYTSAGGIRGTLPDIKTWLAKALGQFPMTQHVVANFTIRIEGDRATSRCSFFNPMGLPLPDGQQGLHILFFGGYYNDTLVRTDAGWRISERIEESTWSYGQLPQGFQIPQ